MSAILELLQHPSVSCFGWALLHSLWQGTLAAVLFALLRLALRKHSAQTRYLAGCLMLLIVVAAPVITVCGGWAKSSALRRDVSADLLISSGIAQASSTFEEISKPAQTLPLFSETMDRLEQALPWLVLSWALGVVAFAGRWLQGSFWVRKIKRLGTTELQEPFLSTLENLRKRLNISRPVRLLKSAIIEVPIVVGWLRPVILLPASILSGLTPTELEVILAHELAHIRRLDYLVNTFQNLVETVMFYHPAIWWISGCIREEREHCCDDLVVEFCGNRLAYARALVSLEELRGVPRLAFAVSGGSLRTRIRRLLGGAVDTRPLGPREFGGLALAALGCLLLLFGAVLTLRPSMYEAAAMIRVQADKDTSSEPSFLQTEAAIIRTPVVLEPVIQSLSLVRASAPNGRDPNLSRRAAVEVLESRLEVRLQGSTRLVKIHFSDGSAVEAARVANAVAKAYQQYRLGQRDGAAQEKLRAVETRVEQLDRQIQEAQKRADELRTDLQIPDAQANADSPGLLTAETLRRIETLRIESQADLAREQTLLERLKEVKSEHSEQLYQVLQTASSADPMVTSLVQGLVAAEQKVQELSNDLGPQHPDVVKAVGRVKDYHHRLQIRAEGHMLGLAAKVASLKSGIENLKREVEKAKEQDIELASRARPCWDARRKVDELQMLRQTLVQKLATERIDSEFSHGPAVDLIAPAVPPDRPSSTRGAAAACIVLGLLFSPLGIWIAKSANP